MSAGVVPRRFRRSRVARIKTPTGDRVDARVAKGLAGRLLGLARLEPELAPPLLIPRCRSVHTFWMRFPIDVVFIAMPGKAGGDARVVEVHHGIPPRSHVRVGRRAGGTRARVATLELPSGAAERLGIEPGESLELHIGGDPRE